MATDRRFLPANLADDTTFRAWSQGIHDQLTGIGLVQTTDAGQVDLATAARPGTVSTYAGYRMYRFADTLQTTKPLFIKLQYGVGNPIDLPQMRWQIATNTNGAGTLTGTISSLAPVMVPGLSKTAGVTLESFCAGNTSRLSLATNLDPANNSFVSVVLIERTIDPDGTPNANGVAMHIFGGSSSFFQIIPFAGALPTLLSGATPWYPSTGHQTADGANVALAPLPLMAAGRVSLASFLRYVHTDIGELTTFSAAHLGATRTFMPLGDAIPASTSLGASTLSLALLWE